MGVQTLEKSRNAQMSQIKVHFTTLGPAGIVIVSAFILTKKTTLQALTNSTTEILFTSNSVFEYSGTNGLIQLCDQFILVETNTEFHFRQWKISLMDILISPLKSDRLDPSSQKFFPSDHALAVTKSTQNFATVCILYFSYQLYR